MRNLVRKRKDRACLFLIFLWYGAMNRVLPDRTCCSFFATKLKDLRALFSHFCSFCIPLTLHIFHFCFLHSFRFFHLTTVLSPSLSFSLPPSHSLTHTYTHRCTCLPHIPSTLVHSTIVHYFLFILTLSCLLYASSHRRFPICQM